MTADVPAGQSVLNVVQTWPIINQMLYPAMIVQSGDQVYGGNPADSTCATRAPCPAGTAATRTGRSTAWRGSTAAGFRRRGDDHLGAGH